MKDKTKKISYHTLKSNRRLGEFVEIIPKNKIKKKDEILEVVH
jgi:hypothetical protein